MRPAAIALLISQTLGCVTLGRFEEREGRVTAMERANEANEERDKKRFDNMTKLVKDSTDKLDKLSASLRNQLDAAQQDSVRLRGLIEEVQFGIAKLGKDVEILRRAAEERWALNFTAAPPAEALPTDPTELMAHGQKMLEAGQFPAARTAFVEFMKRFPAEERVPLAHFGLGRAYLGEKSNKQAVREFGEAFKAWQTLPASKAPPEAADSLWYAGLALENIDCKKAKDMLKFLRQTYPKSARATEAKDKIASLKCR